MKEKSFVPGFLLGSVAGGVIGYEIGHKKPATSQGIFDIAKDVLLNLYGLSQDEADELTERSQAIGEGLKSPPITLEKKWMITLALFTARLTTVKQSALFGSKYTLSPFTVEEAQLLYNTLLQIARNRGWKV